jgi:hypothetical protein
MKWTFAILLSCALGILHGQEDSTKTKKKRFNGLGLTMGYGHALIQLESESQFIPNSSRVLSSSAGNKGGITAGLSFEIKKEKFSIRPAVELSLIFGHVLYDVQRFNKEEGYVLPFTTEIPVHFIYHFNMPLKPSLVIGPRLAIPFGAFESVQPPLKGYGLAGDIALSIPVQTGKNKMRLEFGYSFGLNNLQNREEGNVYSTGIQSVRRDLVFGKLYFN